MCRLSERCPGWLRTPNDYWAMELEDRAQLLAYERIRQEEEAAQFAQLGEMLGMMLGMSRGA